MPSSLNLGSPLYVDGQVSFAFQSASTTATTTMAASSTAQGVLRVAPAVA